MKRKLCKVVSVLMVLAVLLPLGALAAPMEDVSPDDWFYGYVTNGLRFGIIQGVGGGRFEPNRYITRAEFITMLGRLHEYGNETIRTPGDGPFYERYLAWAVEMGIIHGNEHGDLMPYAPLNREQMAAIVYRYIRAFELWRIWPADMPRIPPPEPVADEDEISEWASCGTFRLRFDELMRGIRRNGVLYFKPHAHTSRAEAVAVLARLGNDIVNNWRAFL